MTDRSGDGASVTCPGCGGQFIREGTHRCPWCGVDATDPVFDEILEADAKLHGYRATYDDLIEKWRLLGESRAALLQRLLYTRSSAGAASPASAAPRQGSAATTATPAPAAQQAGVWADVYSASTQPAAASSAATQPATASLPSPVPGTGASAPQAAMPQGRPKPVRTTPRRLTAPALLGVSGASLLIASAIVFIAVTWQTFFPLAQGLIVAAVAAGTAYLSIWLKRHDLVTSGGAVGVVAMAFVGVAIIAFNRVAGALGDFAVPIALVFVAAAGLALSRVGILWVGAAAALALGSSATGLTWAFSRVPNADGRLVWAILGAILASLVLATFPLWKTTPSKLILRLVGVSLLAASSIPLLLDIAWNGRSGLASLVVILPVAGLVGFAIPWPRFTLTSAAVLATVTVAAVAWGQGATQAQAVGLVAAATVVIAAAGALTPATWRNPLLLGLAPASATIAATAVVVAVQLLFLLGGGGHVADWLPFSPFSGVAVVVGGLALAAPGLWTPRPDWLRPLSVVGSVFIAVGVTESSYSIAIRNAPNSEWAVAAAFTVGALLVVVSALLWRPMPARWVAGIAATALATIAGLDGAYALAVRETVIGLCVAVAVVPLVLLAGFGVRWPKATLGSTALLLTTLGASLGYLAEHRVFIAIAAGSMVAAVALWTGARIPATWRTPVLLGFVPAVAIAVGIGLLNALPVTASFLSGGAYETVWVPDLWTSAITGIGGIALGALRQWSIPQRAVSGVSMGGAIVVVAAGASATLTTASAWGLNAHVGLATVGTVAAMVVAAGVLLWNTRAARLVNGIGATVLLFLAGFHGSVAFSGPEASLWLGLAVIAIPIVVLVVFGRWWPAITLGPAAFLVSVAAVSASLHFLLPNAAMLGLVAGSVAMLAWLAAIVPTAWRRPLLFGTAPAALVAGGGSAGLVAFGAIGVLVPSAEIVHVATAAWGIASCVAIVVGALAARRWRVGAAAGAPIEIWGGLSATGAAVLATALVSASWNGSLEMVIASAVGFSIVAAGSIALWSRPAARQTSGIAAIAWLTISSLAGLAFLGREDVVWWRGVVVAIVAIAVLAVAAIRWPDYTAGPAALLVSVGAVATVSSRGASAQQALFAGALALVVVAWVAFAAPRARNALRIGLLPVAGTSAIVLVGLALFTLAFLASSLTRIVHLDPLSPWYGGIVLAGFATALSFPRVQRNVGWVAVGAISMASTALPGHWAWSVVALLAVVAIVLAETMSARVSIADDAVLALSFVAFALAGRWIGALAVTAAIGASIALWLAFRRSGTLVARCLLFAPAYGAFAAGFGALALTSSAGLALTAAMVTALSISIIAANAGLDPTRSTTIAAIALATVFIPMASPAPSRSGVALLIAGAGWLALAVLGWRPGRWVSSGVLSYGMALVLIGAHVKVVEAYTAVPAITILAIGLWWLLDDATVRTMRAIGPGLAVALVPSLLTLMTDPTHLARTLALTGATIVLAFVGVGLRWFAPILATSITAVTVSFTQVFASEQIIPRWVSFAIVGSLLLAIAATYEKLKTLR